MKKSPALTLLLSSFLTLLLVGTDFLLQKGFEALFSKNFFSFSPPSFSTTWLENPWYFLAVRGSEILLLLFFLRSHWAHLFSLDGAKKKFFSHLGIGASLVLLGLLSIYLVRLSERAFDFELFQALFPVKPEDPTAFLLFLFLAAFWGPLAEELFFRVLLIEWTSPSSQAPAWQRRIADFYFVLLFAFLHVANVKVALDVSTLFAFFQWSLCAVFCLGLYRQTRSLLPSLMLHGGANACIYLLMQGWL